MFPSQKTIIANFRFCSCGRKSDNYKVSFVCVYFSWVLLRLLPPLVVVVQPTGRGRGIFLAVLKTFEFQFYKRNFFCGEMSQLPGGPSCPPPPPRSSSTPAACRPKASRTFAPAWSWTHWCCTCKKSGKTEESIYYYSDLKTPFWNATIFSIWSSFTSDIDCVAICVIQSRPKLLQLLYVSAVHNFFSVTICVTCPAAAANISR